LASIMLGDVPTAEYFAWCAKFWMRGVDFCYRNY
jgi:hypothetical protein